MTSPRRVFVGGTPVDLCGPADFVALTTEWAVTGTRTTVVGINAHVVNLIATDPAFATAVRASDLNFPDGQSVVWASRMLGHQPRGRVPLTHMTEAMCGAWAAQGLPMFLLGGMPGVASRAGASLVARFGLPVVGTHHGYFTDDESDAVIDAVNASGARILMVGLGSPRQETWLHSHRGRLHPAVAMTCGGWLDWTAGERRACPPWIYRYGLEWAYRLGQEPRRLFRRYVLGNPQFVYQVIRSRTADRVAAQGQTGATAPVIPHQYAPEARHTALTVRSKITKSNDKDQFST